MANHEPKGVEWMREIAKLGGKASAARRYQTISPAKRRQIAIIANRARWGKTLGSPEAEAAYLQGRKEGLEDAAGWKRRKRSREPVRNDPSEAQSGDHGDSMSTDSNSSPAIMALQSFDIAPVDSDRSSFIDSLDRAELSDALGLAESPKYQALRAALVSPRLRQRSITALARKVGLTPIELLEVSRSYSMSKGLHTLVRGFPKVAESIVQDSMPTQVCCPRCDGLGTCERPPFANEDKAIRFSCPQCQGSGSVRKPGDADARKLLLEATGIIGKRAPLIQQNFVGHSIDSSIDELERASQPLVIDAKFQAT